MDDLIAAQGHASNNRAEIESSKRCGCFCCMQTFAPTAIVGWTGLEATDFDSAEAPDGGTALCPRCGSESVIGDKSGYAIDARFLSRMNEAWHQKTIIYRPLRPTK